MLILTPFKTLQHDMSPTLYQVGDVPQQVLYYDMITVLSQTGEGAESGQEPELGYWLRLDAVRGRDQTDEKHLD